MTRTFLRERINTILTVAMPRTGSVILATLVAITPMYIYICVFFVSLRRHLGQGSRRKINCRIRIVGGSGGSGGARKKKNPS